MSLPRILRYFRRLIGALLILLVTAPIWRLLSSRTGPAANEVLRLSDSYAATMVRGSIAVLAVACVAAFVIRSGSYERPLARLWRFVCSCSGFRYSALLATLAGVLTVALSFYVWDGKPALVDVLAQFIHARYLAAGLLGAAPDLPHEFWVVTNTFVTESGWVSQYPPGHIAVLSVGFRLGVVLLICPAVMAIAVFFTSLTADGLFPDDPTVARLGALLFSVSPFLIPIAASHMSHVTAVALASVAAYLALRARDGSWWWAVGAGMAVGAMFATRPLSAVTIGSVVTLGMWLTESRSRERWFLQFLGTRIGAAALGAVPFLVAVAVYNAHFFGSAFRLGYIAYFGPNHGLGFHADPMGNAFEPLHGLAYTSADLLALGSFLFGSPISVVLVVGIFLLLARRLSSGASLVTAWALVLILPLACYWHHDLFLGPRMLSDSAPAWCLLAVVAGVGLVRQIPDERPIFGRRFSPRAFVGLGLLLSLAFGLGFATPRTIGRYARIFSAPLTPPNSRVPVLVFVHDSWADRMAAQLLASGMRADSVSVALEQNSSCAVQEFVTAYVTKVEGGGSQKLPRLEFGPKASDGSEFARLQSGVVIRKRGDETLTPQCVVQANADSLGTLPLMPLLWQGDLPGIPGDGVMFARDMGPVANGELIARYPQRLPLVLLRRPNGGVIAAASYEEGMGAMWPSEGANR